MKYIRFFIGLVKKLIDNLYLLLYSSIKIKAYDRKKITYADFCLVETSALLK